MKTLTILTDVFKKTFLILPIYCVLKVFKRVLGWKLYESSGIDISSHKT